jgi:hypothetical protein
MNRCLAYPIVVSFMLLCDSTLAFAEDRAAVTIEAPNPKGWVGQRIPLYIKLMSSGPFVSPPAFSLPQLPKIVIVKIGDPVVSSEEDGLTKFTQTHEFALFSQRSGMVELPSFKVRFKSKAGITGDATDHTSSTKSLILDIQRPQKSDANQYLVSTDSLKIEEVWTPSNVPYKQGDIVHRTITQRAEQLAGMALAPPPLQAPEGVRVFADQPVIIDKTERGEFLGERRDTLNCVFEKSGTVTFPAIQYQWWNPEAEEFASVTLPAATFEVAANPSPNQEKALHSKRVMPKPGHGC